MYENIRTVETAAETAATPEMEAMTTAATASCLLILSTS